MLGLGDRVGGRKRGGVGGRGGGRALGEGFVIRVVLGLGHGAGDGEEGGVRGEGRGGGHGGMDGSRKIMRWYPVREVFINVADFNIWWGVWVRESNLITNSVRSGCTVFFVCCQWQTILGGYKNRLEDNILLDYEVLKERCITKQCWTHIILYGIIAFTMCCCHAGHATSKNYSLLLDWNGDKWLSNQNIDYNNSAATLVHIQLVNMMTGCEFNSFMYTTTH